MAISRVAALLGTFLLAATAVPVGAANPFEKNFWNSDLKIVGFQDIRETAFRPWAAQTIPRRFCSAIVLTSDGIRRPLHYSIAEDTGMIGANWGIEWCVTGTDRNWAYNPGCAMAQP